MHGLGPPRAPAKLVAGAPSSKYAWDKPRAGASGTLESLVNQATCFPNLKPPFVSGGNQDLAPWFGEHRGSASAPASATMTMDALVPCANGSDKERAAHVMDTVSAGAGLAVGAGTCLMDCSTRVGSCSGPAGTRQDEDVIMTAGKRMRVAHVPVAPEWSSRDVSVSGSATFGIDSQHMSMTHDTCDRDMGVGFTSTSMGSPENTSSAKPCTRATATTADDHDSVCHSRPQVNSNSRFSICIIII